MERLTVRWLIGAKPAGLQGCRPAGWIIGGTIPNAAFDIALVVGVFAGFVGPVVVLAAIAGLNAALHVTGRRAVLRLRFDKVPHCGVCSHNLTGNLRGICSECGTPILLEAKSAT